MISHNAKKRIARRATPFVYVLMGVSSRIFAAGQERRTSEWGSCCLFEKAAHPLGLGRFR
jgi:hypothetical protein